MSPPGGQQRVLLLTDWIKETDVLQNPQTLRPRQNPQTPPDPQTRSRSIFVDPLPTRCDLLALSVQGSGSESGPRDRSDMGHGPKQKTPLLLRRRRFA
uniref:Uncharacterized protein n=1 Tax=Knipowitschia caucasica TaxID=637954 RepID=A0AAV2J2Q0_KNICA